MALNSFLYRFGPLLGAVLLAVLTGICDFAIDGATILTTDFSAQVCLMVGITAAFIVGAFLGGALSDAQHYLSRAQQADAADSCVRWGLAFTTLFALAPLANVDQAMHHVAAQYSSMLRFHTPAVLASVLVLAWGISLNVRTSHHPDPPIAAA